jgi:hypothetical protein
MMRGREGGMPEPVVFTIDKADDVRAITPGPGLWSLPAWR